MFKWPAGVRWCEKVWDSGLEYEYNMTEQILRERPDLTEQEAERIAERWPEVWVRRRIGRVADYVGYYLLGGKDGI